MLGKGLESLIPKKSGPPQVSKPPEENKENNISSQRLPAQETPATNLPQVSSSFPSPVTRERESGSVHGSRPRKHEHQAIFQIEVEKIQPNPYQPRRHFNDENIRELAASIRDYGFLQPLVVSKTSKETPDGIAIEYQLIAGERRLLAAKSLGLDRVPAIVREVDADRERLEMAIIENLQRENLNPIEMARAFARLQDEFRLTQREIATRLGKSREAIANSVRLLDLPPFIQEALQKGIVSETHGRLLLAISDPLAQEKLFEDLVEKKLTTRELRDRTQEKKAGETEEKKEGLSPELSSLEENLSSRLGAPVKILQAGEGGKITISFYSSEELKSLIARLSEEEEI